MLTMCLLYLNVYIQNKYVDIYPYSLIKDKVNFLYVNIMRYALKYELNAESVYSTVHTHTFFINDNLYTYSPVRFTRERTVHPCTAEKKFYRYSHNHT
jgi:hypothetical protein